MHLTFTFETLGNSFAVVPDSQQMYISLVCVSVEWRIVSLRVLSDITLLLLNQEVMEEEEQKKETCDLEGKSSNTRLLTLITEALLPQ